MGGVSLIPVESVIVKEQPDIPALSDARGPHPQSDGWARELVLAPWIPMTLLTTGGLTVLYSIALPRKGQD